MRIARKGTDLRSGPFMTCCTFLRKQLVDSVDSTRRPVQNSLGQNRVTRSRSWKTALNYNVQWNWR